MEICRGSVEKETLEVCDSQIELSVENPTDLGELPVEVPGVVPTVVVEEEEDSSVEVLASGKKMVEDQVEGTGAEPVPEAVELEWEGQAVGTGEHVYEEDGSGEELDLMEVDQAIRTGDAPGCEVIEERTGAEPVPEEVEEETGAMPARETGEGDLHFED